MKLVLVLTSSLFLTNFIHNAYYRCYVYAWLFLLLSITSIFIHSEIFLDWEETHNGILVMDKIILFHIFLYGLYLHCKTGISIFPIISFCLVSLIYSTIYYMKNDYENKHMIMHIIGSLGHHSIIYEYGNSLKSMVKQLQ